MVATLTFTKKGYQTRQPEMDEAGQQAQELKDFFALAVDRDTDAFNDIIGAMRLPRKSDEQKAARLLAIEEATKGAVQVPYQVLERTREAAALAAQMVAKGNPNSLSDAGVASLCARLAARGAYYNVLINLPGLSDTGYVESTRTEAAKLLAAVLQICDDTDAAVENRLLADLNEGDLE